MERGNIEDIIPLVSLTKDLPVDVRFIEEMPFNGGNNDISLKWNFAQIYNYIKDHFLKSKRQRILKVQHHTIIKFRDLQEV
jgi:molybdenum cofactor biosynthesis enzyme MoaA